MRTISMSGLGKCKCVHRVFIKGIHSDMRGAAMQITVNTLIFTHSMIASMEGSVAC